MGVGIMAVSPENLNHEVTCNRCHGTGKMMHQCNEPRSGDYYYFVRESHPGNEALAHYYAIKHKKIEGRLERCKVCGWYWLRFFDRRDMAYGSSDFESFRIPPSICFGAERPADDSDFLSVAKGVE